MVSKSMLSIFITLFALLLCKFCEADVVLLKTGKKLEGKILEETATEVKIEVVFGKSKAVMMVSRKDIEKIEMGELKSEEFNRRFKTLGPDDLQGHKDLQAWCRTNKLFELEKLVVARLSKVVIEARKKKYPKKWCRNCDAVGMAPCVDCEGAGAVSTPCSRCTGSGEGKRCVTCVGVEDSLLDCRRCGGAGTYERFDPVIGKKVKTRCRDCSGKGKIVCPVCKGKKKKSCKECKGNGKFLNKCQECLGKKRVSCAKCSGTGLTGESGDPKPVEEKKKKQPKKKPVVEVDPFG
ncbi:MAG: hypothetical protein OSB09_06845 [Planctomycetota bacterium]|nr:hypothetical protein [Planctomycetota bacterium]